MALAKADIQGVLFTGSTQTGLALHTQFAGRPDVILALELGGHNALIIDKGVDAKAAAYETVMSAYMGSGQRCTCARRLIIPDDGDGVQYLKALTALMDRIVVAGPFDEPQPFMGPVISARAAEGLERAFDQRLESGGEAIRTLSVQEEGGAFVSPGLIDVTDVDNLPDEEHFGPMLQVVRVADFDAAIAAANATRFGLSAGLLSDARAEWDHFLALSRAGIVNWNRQTTGASSAAPFGGVGHSGNHRPSAYYAADYCAYPVASMEGETLPPMPGGQVGVRPK